MKLGMMKLLALAGVLAVGVNEACQFTPEGLGANFDLRGLQEAHNDRPIKVRHYAQGTEEVAVGEVDWITPSSRASANLSDRVIDDDGDQYEVRQPGESSIRHVIEIKNGGRTLVLKDESARPYYYYFSLCENTNFGTRDAPLWYPDHLCDDEEQREYRTSMGFAQQAPAWQVNSGGEDGSVTECYRLGHATADGQPAYDFALLDPADESRSYDADPSEGFILKYSSAGDNAPEDESTHEHHEGGCPDGERDLYIEFQCDEDATGQLTAAPMVFEEPTCSYRVLFRTAWGCPTECPRDESGVPCGGNGVCGFNRRANAAQCFCDGGYTGAACLAEVPADTSNAALMGLLVVVFLLLAAVSVVLVYMCYKARRVLAHDKYVGLLGPLGDSGPIHDDGVGEKL